MARHSFIQMSKLPNVKGRISYITSHARQENLYATYRTADNAFWNNLARESRQEFQRSGAEGKCIEARELIIALPEVYTQYEPQQVLEDFTDEFRRRYGVECVSALHHNKRKTNYHIHLIFSERKLLPEPDVKIATRSVFFDETGKRVRTKKEITGEDGQIRKGCTITVRDIEVSIAEIRIPLSSNTPAMSSNSQFTFGRWTISSSVPTTSASPISSMAFLIASF